MTGSAVTKVAVRAKALGTERQEVEVLQDGGDDV